MVTDFLADCWAFLGDVFSHWQSWLSGSGLVGAALILYAIWERVTGKPMDNRMYLSILIGLFLFGASFAAWWSRYRELRELQEKLRSPELLGTLTFVATGAYSSEKQDVLIFVELSVRNPFGPPSAMYNWEMTAEIAGPRTLIGEVAPGPDYMLPLVLQGFGSLKLDPASYVLIKMDQPVPAGGIASGWLWAVFRDIRLARLHEDRAMITVSFCDAVTGKRHVLQKNLEEPGVRIPGLPRIGDPSLTKT
jgi:hypothetical protein